MALFSDTTAAPVGSLEREECPRKKTFSDRSAKQTGDRKRAGTRWKTRLRPALGREKALEELAHFVIRKEASEVGFMCRKSTAIRSK